MDPMRHLRIAILGQSPCDECRGANCCRQNGHEFAVLLEPAELARFGPYAVSVNIEQDGRWFTEKALPYVNGRCQFLGPDNRCLIYNDRPMNCRRFQCVSHFHNGGRTIGEHGPFLVLNPDVTQRLEQLGLRV